MTAGGSADLSFDRAVKHLFRHLHETRALRDNPLVAHHFEHSPATEISRIRDDRAAVERIHRLVRMGAESCRDRDIAAGDDRRAQRRFTIVTSLLEGLPIARTAERLEISFRHCYRERAAICRDVALYVRDHRETLSYATASPLDEFRRHLEIVRRTSATTRNKASFRTWDELIAAAPSIADRADALRIAAEVAMERGHQQRAESALRTARELTPTDQEAVDPLLRLVAHACADLIEFHLAYARTDLSTALGLAQRATSALEGAEVGRPHIAELRAEGLYLLGMIHCNLGDLEAGYDAIAAAQSLADRKRGASIVHPRIAAELWRLRNHLLTSAKSWYPSAKRLEGIRVAFNQARAVGSALDAVAALVTLTEYQVVTGNETAAFSAAHSAVNLAAQQPNRRIHAQTAIRLAIMLASTRYWANALKFVPPHGDDENAFARELTTCLAAWRAFRLGDFNGAYRTASESDNDESRLSEKTPLRYPVVSMRKHLIVAASAQRLGRRSEAAAILETALPVAKRLSSAPLLRDVHALAAAVTGDRRHQREAAEIGRLLTA